ncbi:hypothetical protein Bca4012_032162 [Brassica carinata]|uniref:Plant disease resistance WDH domain-containing protein n=1 Tax=Brassica carinata TaxID=52824 RepID=A0A8X7RG21_BRACI|nr:hypothetical protein Bca52824_046936 [Brassica carinata]
MVVAGGWLAPGPVLASLLALAAYKLPEKHRGLRRRLRCAIACGFPFPKSKRSGAEAASMLLRFNIARTSIVKLGFIQIRELGKPRNRYGGFASCCSQLELSYVAELLIVCTNALEAADQELVTPVGEVARQVSLLETGSDKRTAKPCSLGRTCSDSSHRVRDKI